RVPADVSAAVSRGQFARIDAQAQSDDECQDADRGTRWLNLWASGESRRRISAQGYSPSQGAGRGNCCIPDVNQRLSQDGNVFMINEIDPGPLAEEVGSPPNVSWQDQNKPEWLRNWKPTPVRSK